MDTAIYNIQSRIMCIMKKIFPKDYADDVALSQSAKVLKKYYS
jgi:hypothetical protein